MVLNVNNRNPLDKNIYTILVLICYLSPFQILAPAPIKLIEGSSLISLCFPPCMRVSMQYKHKSAYTSKQERVFFLHIYVLLHIVVLTHIWFFHNLCWLHLSRMEIYNGRLRLLSWFYPEIMGSQRIKIRKDIVILFHSTFFPYIFFTSSLNSNL